MAHRVTISAADAERRLDRFLFAYMREAPQPLVYKLLRKKRIKLNGTRAEGGEMLAAGDFADFYLSPETLEKLRGVRPPPPEAQKLTGIIYKDSEWLVVNKPAGLVCHGGGADHGSNGNSTDHLLGRVLWYLYATGAYDPANTFTPALCNRLDTNTSGLVLCGKTSAALRRGAALLRGETEADDGIVKEYLAVAEGELHGGATLIGAYEKDPATNTARITPVPQAAGITRIPQADSDAKSTPAAMLSDIPARKHAITRYRSLAVTKVPAPATLLLVSPLTGRSHQIRAHLASIGHPLAGDKKYGGTPSAYAPAQLLHAWRLTLPAGEAGSTLPQVFTAPLPQGFLACLREWFGLKE